MLWIPRYPGKPQKIKHRHRIARWDCPIIEIFFPGKDLFAIVRSDEKSTIFIIPEMFEQIIVNFKRGLQITYFERSFIKLDQSPDEKSIIIKKTRYCSFPIPVPMIKSSIFVSHF